MASAPPSAGPPRATARARHTPTSPDTATTPENAVAATSFAEAGPPREFSAAMLFLPDDHGPLLILVAIGLVAFIVTIEAGRVALRR